MKRKKYYWLVYSYNNWGDGKTYAERVTDKHPFEFMTAERGVRGRLAVYNITLMNFKEITKSEFDAFV
jgi:hypothetical protein